MDALLVTIARRPLPPRADAVDRLALLLADVLGCVRYSVGRPAPAAFAADGVAGEVALLALRAGADDRDDVDWRTLHHPGSVVWPVVLALGAARDAPGAVLTEAARRGYATAAQVADLLGPGHRAAWHVTATAGAVGAAAAAAVLLDLPDDGRARALALAAANTGGLSRAAAERRGAATFNRAAAATLGLTAARAAAVGAVPVADPLGGPGGLLTVMTGAAPAGPATVGELPVRDGLDDAAVRPYPVSGFLQGAVAGSAAARSVLAGDLRGLRIGLAAGALPLVDGADAGAWWDARTSVLRAWAGADAYAAATSSPLEAHRELVELVVAEVPAGHAHVVATTDAGETETVGVPIGAEPAAELTRKWSGPYAVGGTELIETARAVLGAAGAAGIAGEWVR